MQKMQQQKMQKLHQCYPLLNIKRHFGHGKISWTEGWRYTTTTIHSCQAQIDKMRLKKSVYFAY